MNYNERRGGVERGVKVTDIERNSEVSQSEGIRRRIDAAKATLREKYSVCKASARRLSGAYSRLIDAESKLDIKQSARLISKHAIQETEYNVALKEYFSYASLYTSLIDDVLELYNEYYLLESGRAAKKIKAESVKFETQQFKVKQKIMDAAKDVSEAIGAFDKQPDKSLAPEKKKEQLQNEDEPAASQQKQEQQAGNSYAHQGAPYSPHQPFEYRPYMPQGVNIAPMSIDISGIVQDAVSAAMAKFKVAFDKQANAFIESMPQNDRPANNPQTDNGAVAPLVQAAVEEESVIVEKLSALMEKLKALSEEMTALGAAYMQLANTQRDAEELQRRINDMQRAISREIQGVQANQKVINQDQAAVSAEQAVVMEQQKAMVEGQKLIAEAQENIADMQKTVVETQGALEETVRSMLASQKDIITSQQNLLNANAKNIELQRELGERQAELSEMQKSVASAHKQLFRTQRAFNAKHSIPEKKEKKTEDKPAEELSQPLPEEVSLDEIKVGKSD